MANVPGLMTRITGHFSQRLEEVRRIEIPEWGDPETGAPLVICVKPMTMKVRDAIHKHINAGSLEACVEALIQRARTEEGKRVFADADRFDLMNKADPEVIFRIVREMNSEIEPTLEDARGN